MLQLINTTKQQNKKGLNYLLITTETQTAAIKKAFSCTNVSYKNVGNTVLLNACGFIEVEKNLMQSISSAEEKARETCTTEEDVLAVANKETVTFTVEELRNMLTSPKILALYNSLQ